jgi:DNA repair and recombination protein RAD54B
VSSQRRSHRSSLRRARLGSSAWKGGALGPGSELTVGGKEVEIDAPTTAEAYTSGSLFMSMDLVPTPAAAAPAPSFFAAPAPSFKAPASTKAASFYGPPKASGSKPPTKAFAAALAGKGPVPKFDPGAKGAVVMKRPDARQAARINPKGLPIVDVVVDPYIGQHLRPHQAE